MAKNKNHTAEKAILTERARNLARHLAAYGLKLAHTHALEVVALMDGDRNRHIAIGRTANPTPSTSSPTSPQTDDDQGLTGSALAQLHIDRAELGNGLSGLEGASRRIGQAALEALAALAVLRFERPANCFDEEDVSMRPEVHDAWQRPIASMRHEIARRWAELVADAVRVASALSDPPTAWQVRDLERMTDDMLLATHLISSSPRQPGPTVARSLANMGEADRRRYEQRMHRAAHGLDRRADHATQLDGLRARHEMRCIHQLMAARLTQSPGLPAGIDAPAVEIGIEFLIPKENPWESSIDDLLDAVQIPGASRLTGFEPDDAVQAGLDPNEQIEELEVLSAALGEDALAYATRVHDDLTLADLWRIAVVVHLHLPESERGAWNGYYTRTTGNGGIGFEMVFG